MNIKDIEKSIYSQNGEDGIIEYLVNLLPNQNKILLEVGNGGGNENNSFFLCEEYDYSGVVVDKKPDVKFKHYSKKFKNPPTYLDMFVTKDTVPVILKELPKLDIDFLSIDIDGMDYYIAEELFNLGLRPKIVCVEFNYVFGPTDKCTIKYTSDFVRTKASKSASHNNYIRLIAKHLYGASYNLWQDFFNSKGYKFFTTESSGVNLFFYDQKYITISDNIVINEYIQNRRFQSRYGNWTKTRAILDEHCSDFIYFV